MGVGKRSSKGPLQEVLGQGANINKANPLEVHDPKVGSLISYEGVTTANGAADGSTLIDNVLTARPDYNGNLVIITSGAYAGQARDINGVTTGGTVTPLSAFGGQIVSGTTFIIAALRLTPAEVAAIEAKLDHASHGLAALKALIDALEGKLDVPANFMADVSALALEATLGTHDTDIKTLLDALEGKLDVPANFMADVSALALEATLGTHDTDIKTLLATIAGYIDTEVAAIITSQGRMLFSMDFWSDMQEEVQLTSTAGDKGLPSVVIADLPDTATIVRAIAMFKFRMVENIHATEPNNLVLDQYIQVKKTGQSYTNAIKMINLGFAIAAATREGGDVIIGNIDLAAVNQVDANATYEFQWTSADAAQDSLNYNDIQCGLKIFYSV